jgi:Na+-driven multidrug efflux pump
MLGINIPISYLGVLLLKNIWGAALAGPISLIAGIIVGYYHLRKHINYSIKEIIQSGYYESINFLKKK